ncbi:hypothetical protein [Xylella fastidiosa]|uniref:hypothetical protein n=1 Tax=Xylella fastidiosa TaxID=2371 RepID=UPI001E427E08|nr:hypothetical protein [Xylella fastidiosa]MDG5822628.1 hypothetical protein [Xylella fastidiosa subsp. pauca]
MQSALSKADLTMSTSGPYGRMPPIPLAALLQHRHLNGRHPFAHRKWRCITAMHCPTHRADQRQRNPHRGNFASKTHGAANAVTDAEAEYFN